MKRLTKYKDGKFLLNHSSMNEAIDKLGKLEIIDELNRNKVIYETIDGGVHRMRIMSGICRRALLSEDGENLLIVEEFKGYTSVQGEFEFSEYKKTWSLNVEDLE